jgi:iron uptake system component EfeO
VKNRAASLPTLALGGALLLAACGGGGSSSTSGSRGQDAGRKQVDVSFTDAGCRPGQLSLAAGPTMFNVTNDGASNVTEYEVLDGTRILGEVENLADGFKGSFSLTLQPGKYTIYCPGGESERGTLVVGGAAAVAESRGEQRAVAAYRAYLKAQTALLVTRTRAWRAAIDQGDLAAAKRLFPTVREPYERIEPVAESFGDLDPFIDARAGDVPAAKWEGFHRIEKRLWVDRTLAGTRPLADRLVENTLRLEGLVQSVPLQPAQIANGAKGLLDEVAASKITGEEDRYSHTDLWDFRANVDGARAAIAAVRPLLLRRNVGLARTIDQRFQAVDRALDGYRRGAGFALYTVLTPRDTRSLSRAVNSLAEPVSQVAPLIL